MTTTDMKLLKVGDIVKDLDVSTKWGRIVLCEVIEVSEDGLVLTSLKDSDKGGYPHRFSYDGEAQYLQKINVL